MVGLTTRKMSEKLSSLVFPQQCDSDQDFTKTRGGWLAHRGQQKVLLQTPSVSNNSHFNPIVIQSFWFSINRFMHFQWKTVHAITFNLRHLNLNKKWWLSRVNSVNLCKLCDKSDPSPLSCHLKTQLSAFVYLSSQFLQTPIQWKLSCLAILHIFTFNQNHLIQTF